MYPRGPAHLSQRKLSILQEDWTSYREDFHQYHQGLPIHMWTEPIQVRQGYTPRGTITSPLPGVTVGVYFLWPSGWGGTVWVPTLGNNSGIAANAPVQTLITIWFPSKDPATLREHNALPATHEWLHHSSIPWSKKVTRNALWIHLCLWLVQVNTRLLWLLSDLMLPNFKIILSPSTTHHLFWVGLTPPLYDNQCMVLFPDWVNTHPLEWNRTSGQVTL